MVLTETGEDVVIHCSACGYAANAEKATSRKDVAAPSGAADEAPLPLEEVTTPHSTTIEQVAVLLNVPSRKTLKAVFYMADGQFVLAVIRGDLEVNEVKLQRALKCTLLRLAEAEEVDAAGIVAGFASPIGASNVTVVADDSVPGAVNLVAGANRPGYHYLNSNYGRDYTAGIVADITLAQKGDRCPSCSAVLSADRGIEVGHIFKLGTFLSEKLSALFLDESGRSRPAVMGCYGIGVGRLLAAIVEHWHDDKGILWPMAVAPYQVHLCTLNPDKDNVAATGEQLYGELQKAGIDVLYDDRAISAGVKFNDADLIGIPVRLTVSPRTLGSNSVETKRRNEKESRLVPLEQVVSDVDRTIREELAAQRGAEA
jgi:prolyl-tRNA synthetase